jgi:AcrR family transcriptional regulator
MARRLPAAERRSVVVETVLTLAAKQNPSEITTTTIAAHMQMTQGALFRHFATKDAIWQAVMEWVSAQLLMLVRTAAQAAASPRAALEAVFNAHLDFVVHHPGVPRMLFSELQRACNTPAKRTVQKLLRRYGELLHTLLEQGKAQGQLAADVDTTAAATLFIGTIQGLIMQSLLAGKAGRMRVDAPSVFSIYLRGIGSIR